MEKALRELGSAALYNTEHLHNWPLVEEYPLSREIMALSHVWDSLMSQVLVYQQRSAGSNCRSLSS